MHPLIFMVSYSLACFAVFPSQFWQVLACCLLEHREKSKALLIPEPPTAAFTCPGGGQLCLECSEGAFPGAGGYAGRTNVCLLL